MDGRYESGIILAVGIILFISTFYSSSIFENGLGGGGAPTPTITTPPTPRTTPPTSIPTTTPSTSMIQLQEGVNKGHLESDDFTYYYLDVPSNIWHITILLDAIQADFDLYMANGYKPTIRDFDYKSNSYGFLEKIDLWYPSTTQRYYIMVKSNRVSGDYTLKLTSEERPKTYSPT